MDWKTATLESITSLSLDTRRNTFSRQGLIDAKLSGIVAAVGSAGTTPAQTLSRVLQGLRDEGYIEFLGRGEYRLLNSTHTPVATDVPTLDTPGRVPTTVGRIVRDSALVSSLKRRYCFRCQLCDTRLELSSGFYCESHHIRPLGRPHGGPDSESNLVIVCPNHHVLLDYGAIRFDLESFATLAHHIDPIHVEYHNVELYKGA